MRAIVAKGSQDRSLQLYWFNRFYEGRIVKPLVLLKDDHQHVLPLGCAVVLLSLLLQLLLYFLEEILALDLLRLRVYRFDIHLQDLPQDSLPPIDNPRDNDCEGGDQN